MKETAFTVATAHGRMPVTALEPDGKTTKGGIIFYMDAFGIREELFGMCRRYANAGYAVFIPDLFYRGGTVRFPVPGSAAAKLDPEMGKINVATTVEMSIADTGCLLVHVAAMPRLNINQFCTVGYCMGARHALGAAATYPDKILAAACLHGGRMVWEGSNSPHRYIPACKASLYFAFAANDETCPDAHKALIEKTIRESGARGVTEHFDASHGWTFPTRWCYDQASAEHVFQRVVNLFDAEMDGNIFNPGEAV